MAATGYTPISLYYSTTASAVPSAGNLANGELALNTADMKLYAKNSSGTVTLLASNASTTPVTPAGSNTQIQFNNSGSFGASSSLTWNGSTFAITGGASLSGDLTQSSTSGRITYSNATTSGNGGLQNNTGGSYVLLYPSTHATKSNHTDIAGTNINFVVGGTIATVTSTGLGVGTTSPVAKLDTAGTIRSTTQTVPASGTGAELYYDATNAGLRGYNRTSSAYVNLALNDNVYIGGGSSGNVGLGTSSPATKLHVVGNVRSSNSAGTVFSTLATDGVYATGTDLYLLAPTGYSTIIYANNSEKFRVGTAGQLGIGGANYGSSGQVLTSAGSGAAPTWSTVSAGSKAADVQTFTSSGTWTKPSGFGAKARAFIQCWGGGGSGGSGSNCISGGGGGGYNERWVTLSSLGSTETATVGAGGSAVSGAGAANAGGNTSFGSWVSAYGGGGGYGNSSTYTALGGGGGGQLSAGITGTNTYSTSGFVDGGGGGRPYIMSYPRHALANSLKPLVVSFASIASYAMEGSTGANYSNQPYVIDSFWHGGGGGFAQDQCGSYSVPGADSVFGGGGGGAILSGNLIARAGGTSMNGGNGGAAANGAATSGTAPGGGGGASRNSTSGAGGAGLIVVTVFDGA